MENDRFDRIAKAIGRRTTRRLAVGMGALFAGFTGLRRDVPLSEAAGNDFCRTLEPDQIISKSVDITAREHQRFPLMLDDVPKAENVGADDRRFARHRLEERDSE